MSAGAAAPDVHVARWRDLDAETAYAILQLRTTVFVVEQRCAYQDIDGRDREEDARQLWIAAQGRVVSTLRLLREQDGSHRIGKVATHASFRGRGFGAALVAHALQLTDGDVVLNAQAQLTGWYERFGFAVSGAEWVDEGIAHVPMRRLR